METSPVSHHLDKSHCFQVETKAQLAAGPDTTLVKAPSPSAGGGMAGGGVDKERSDP